MGRVRAKDPVRPLNCAMRVGIDFGTTHTVVAAELRPVTQWG